MCVPTALHCLHASLLVSLQDQRDALLGRVFGLAALARSGLAMVLPAAPAGAAAVQLRGVAVVAEQLVGLLQRKVFLRESAAAALVELLSQLSTEQMQQVRALSALNLCTSQGASTTQMLVCPV